MTGPVFISHSSRDKVLAAGLAESIRACGVDAWLDARELTAGDQLEPEIQRALEGARAVVVLLSPRTINSRWVTKEVRYALELRKQRGPEYKVIPVMCDGIEPSALHFWFGEEPLGLALEAGPGGLQNILPALLDGLGLSLPSYSGPSSPVEASPLADLTLELSDPYIDASGGRHQGAATAELIYRPAEAGAREVRSRRFKLVAPMGPIEAEELRWYLERYVIWPSGVFQERARRVGEVPAQRVREVMARKHGLSLGELPPPPEHGFLGRSRELLKAERLLEGERYVVLRGEGGEGKTTLAAELARWLVETRRYEQVAFAGLEHHGEARSLLYALGRQLVAGFESRAGQDEGRGWLEVERALRERRTLVVLDNMESVLPPEEGAALASTFEPEVLEKVLKLAEKLSTVGETRLVFTSRQAMPSPFANNYVPIGRMGRSEAIDLVARALGREEQAPRADDPGESEDEVTRLVDAVGCHARSLVLVAREVAESGVRNATERLSELMARMQERYPGDRERSLYASVELSLRRLPEGMREAIRPLGVFQGGGHLPAIAYVLGLDPENPQHIQALAAPLVRVGLAEPLEYGYLRLDPALGPLLLGEMSEAERAAARDQWAEIMAKFTGFLYQQQHSANPMMASVLTLLDLANLLGALDHLGATAPAERVVSVATNLESLLQFFGRPKALARASRVREEAAAGLGKWSHAKFISESETVDRLMDAGHFQKAISLARSLLERAQAASESAYEGAAFDLAIAHAQLGRSLSGTWLPQMPLARGRSKPTSLIAAMAARIYPAMGRSLASWRKPSRTTKLPPPSRSSRNSRAKQICQPT